jgi:hypothetical protein
MKEKPTDNLGCLDFKTKRELTWSLKTDKAQAEYFKDLEAITVLFNDSVVNTDLSVDAKKVIELDLFEEGYGVKNIKLAAAEWLVRQKNAYDAMNRRINLINDSKHKSKAFINQSRLELDVIRTKVEMDKIKQSTEWLFKPTHPSSKSPSPFEAYWGISRYAARKEKTLSIMIADENGEEQPIEIDVQRVHQAFDDLNKMASYRK